MGTDGNKPCRTASWNSFKENLWVDSVTSTFCPPVHTHTGGHSWQEKEQCLWNQPDQIHQWHQTAGQGTKVRSMAWDHTVINFVQQIIAKIRALPGNKRCADCGAPDPEWLSVNLGILICIHCSGRHREMSVQYSRIRSLKLDQIKTHELLVGTTYKECGLYYLVCRLHYSWGMTCWMRSWRQT